MSVSPEALDDGNFQIDPLDTAQELFLDASQAYAQSIGFAILSHDESSIHAVCQEVGKRAERLASAGQMLAKIAQAEDPANATSLIAGSIWIHNSTMKGQFLSDNPRASGLSFNQGLDFYKQLIDEKVMIHSTGKSDQTQAFQEAIRAFTLENAMGWVKIYSDFLTSMSH